MRSLRVPNARQPTRNPTKIIVPMSARCLGVKPHAAGSELLTSDRMSISAPSAMMPKPSRKESRMWYQPYPAASMTSSTVRSGVGGGCAWVGAPRAGGALVSSSLLINPIRRAAVRC